MIRIPSRLNIRLRSSDIALVGMMTATMEVGKFALSYLPNIEPVTLFIILYTLTFGPVVFYAIAIFILLEGLLYGFGLWWFFYLYIWPLLALLTLLFRKQKSVWFWTVFSAMFGLTFGAMSSLITLILSGPAAAFAYFISGIPFDLLHGGGNFVLMLAMYKPLRKVLTNINHHLRDKRQEERR